MVEKAKLSRDDHFEGRETDLVCVGRDVVVPRHERDFGTFSTQHPDDVVLYTAIHSQHLNHPSSRVVNTQRHYRAALRGPWDSQSILNRLDDAIGYRVSIRAEIWRASDNPTRTGPHQKELSDQ